MATVLTSIVEIANRAGKMGRAIKREEIDPRDYSLALTLLIVLKGIPEKIVKAAEVTGLILSSLPSTMARRWNIYSTRVAQAVKGTPTQSEVIAQLLEGDYGDLIRYIDGHADFDPEESRYVVLITVLIILANSEIPEEDCGILSARVNDLINRGEGDDRVLHWADLAGINIELQMISELVA